MRIINFQDFKKRIWRVGIGIITGIMPIWLILYLLTTPTDILKAERIVLPQLSCNSEVFIDAQGVVHLRAANEADLYACLGFINAAQQLDFMDRLLRAATGRLAESYGVKAVEWDRYTRTLGFAQQGEQYFARMAPEVRAALEAYCSGVNALIRQYARQVSLQVRLRYNQPLKWTPAGCIAVLRFLEWIYLSDWERQVFLTKLVAIYGTEKVNAGFPLVHCESDITTDLPIRFFSDLNIFWQRWQELQQFLGFSPAESNLFSWAVPAKNLDSVSSVLLVENNFLTAKVLLVALSCPEYEAIGYVIPGVPFMFIGRNERLAWGMNYRASNGFDLYALKLDSLRTTYQTPDGERPLEKAALSLSVRRGKEYNYEVYRADQMPLLAWHREVNDSIVTALACWWEGANFDEMPLLYALPKIKSHGELAAISSQSYFPSVELIWADVTGAAGRLNTPLRPIAIGPNGLRLTNISLRKDLLATDPDSILLQNLVLPSELRGHTIKIASRREIFSLEQLINASLLANDPYGESIWEACRPILKDSGNAFAHFVYNSIEHWNYENWWPSIAPLAFNFFRTTLLTAVYADELELVDNKAQTQCTSQKEWAWANLSLLLQDGSNSWFDDLKTADRVEFANDIIKNAWHKTIESLVKENSGDTMAYSIGRLPKIVSSTIQNQQSPILNNLIPGLKKKMQLFHIGEKYQTLVMPLNDNYVELITYAPDADFGTRMIVCREQIDCELINIIPESRLITFTRRMDK